MAKKIIWGIGIFLAAIIVLALVAGIVVYFTVDKKFVASHLARALNRQVTIEAMDVNIFSVFSGIEVKKVVISNFKTPEERAKLEGKPVSPEDTFARLDAFRFKIALLPLLKREVKLKELLLVRPSINLVKYKDGSLNISDFLLPPKGAAVEERKEEAPMKAVSADMIPAAISVGEIGLKDGTIEYYDSKLEHRFKVYNLTFLLHEIEIDPSDLEKRDVIKLTFHAGLKTVGPIRTGSVQTFNVVLEATGKVIPFDVKSRLLDPEVLLHLSLPEGEVTGLKIFDAVASIPILGEYLGEYVSFLKGTQRWKESRESGLDLRYKGDQLELKNGRLTLAQARISFAGAMNVKTKKTDLDLGIAMSREISESVKGTLARRVGTLIVRPEVKKYVSAEALAQAALKPLLNPEGAIFFMAKVGGTTEKPEVKIVKPELRSLPEVIKEATSQVALEAGKEVVKGAAKDLMKGEGQKVLDNMGDLLKKR